MPPIFNERLDAAALLDAAANYSGAIVRRRLCMVLYVIQLVIDGTPYPETSQDNYVCHIEEHNEYIRTASGRVVELVGVRFVVIEYSFGLMRPDFLSECLKTLRSGKDLPVYYLSPEYKMLVPGYFKCTRKPEPQYAFSLQDRGHFHNISFRLEEVNGLA